MKKFTKLIWLPIVLCFILIYNSVIFASENNFSNKHYSNQDSILNDEDMPEVSDLVIFDEPVLDFSTELVTPSENALRNNVMPFASTQNVIANETDSILYDGQTFTEYRANNQQMDITDLTITFDDGQIIEIPESYNKDNTFDINSYIETTSGSGIRAKTMRGPSLPDLHVDELKITTPGYNIPQAFRESHVEFYLYNYGTQNVDSIKIDFIEDREFLFSIGLLSFPGNHGAVVSFNYKQGFKYGSYPIAVKVDPSNKIIESNENNNEFSDNFKFDGTPQLVVLNYGVRAINNEEKTNTDDVVTMDIVEYGFTVRNLGNGTSYGGKDIYLYINDKYVQKFGLKQIDTYTSLSVGFEIRFKKKGNYNLELRLDSVPYEADISVDYNIERFTSKMAGANDLTVMMEADVINEYSPEFLEAYKEWNFISSKVSFKQYTQAPSGANWNNCDILVKLNKNLPPGVVGKCQLFKKGGLLGLGDPELIPDYWVPSETASFVYANIFIKDNLTKSAVLKHEMGHAIGLAHLDCQDFSVMTEDLGDSNASETITGHDIHCLLDIYNS